jgi:probable F420-dependent oxidoreductase
MKYGIYAVLTATTIAPKSLARAIEERGFDSMWVPEHSHIPLTSTYPGGVATITREYGQTLDPFVALAAAASVTERIGLGTGICLLTQRDTIQTAKVVATLDHLSNGRVLFGVGGGWNKPEMENHGTTYATRFQKLEEQLEAVKVIWAQDEPEFHGEHVHFDKMWCWPKPVARPHPPIYIGGESDHTLKRIVKHADGWLPRMRDPKMVLGQITKLRTFARDAGRDPKSIAISAFGLPAREEAIAPFREAGVDRVVVALAPGSYDDVAKKLDEYAKRLALA